MLISFTLHLCCQHDSGIECTPGESKEQNKKEKGNYIMYARATSGDKLNNNKFSICSIRNISAVLKKKKDDCFVGRFSVNSLLRLSVYRFLPSRFHACCMYLYTESGQPICGNGLVEAEEECDCGYSDQCNDPCCYNANEAEDKKCKLKPDKLCRSDGTSPPFLFGFRSGYY